MTKHTRIKQAAVLQQMQAAITSFPTSAVNSEIERRANAYPELVEKARAVVEQYRKRAWTDLASGGPGAELDALLRSLGEG